MALRVTAAGAAAVWLACAGAAPSPRSVREAMLPSVEETPRLPARVLLVSVAGLTPDAYRGTAGSPPAMPTLAALARAGVSADAVVPVAPSSVYPAHATLVTGRSPDGHGIVGDRLLGDRGMRATPYWHASHLQGEPIWQAARESRLSVASLGWPSTVGAEIDLLLPDITPVRRGETWLDVLAGATTPWLLKSVSRQAPGGDALAGWPTPAQRDAILVGLACEIAYSQSTPALWLLYLSGPDAAQGRHGPGSAQAQRAFADTDAQLARLVKCLRDSEKLVSSVLVVTGDRPVRPVHTLVNPNVVLAEAGLLTPDITLESGIRSWSAIARTTQGSAFVYARDERAALDARSALEEAAARTAAFRVVSAVELRSLRADRLAWFGLEAEPGYVFGPGVRGEPVLRAALRRGAGGYLPGADDVGVGFVAWGAGLRGEIRVPRMHQTDVAPTVAALLGVPLDGSEGRVLIGALRSEWIQNAPAVGAGEGDER